MVPDIFTINNGIWLQRQQPYGFIHPPEYGLQWQFQELKKGGIHQQVRYMLTVQYLIIDMPAPFELFSWSWNPRKQTIVLWGCSKQLQNKYQLLQQVYTGGARVSSFPISHTPFCPNSHQSSQQIFIYGYSVFHCFGLPLLNQTA